MKLQISFFSQTLYYGLSSVVARLVNFLLVPLYIIAFPAEEYGIVAIFYSVITFLAIIFSLGMETTFFRFANQVEDKKELYSTAAIILFFSSIICLLTGQIILQVSPPEYLYLLFPLPLVYIVWLFLITFIDTLCVLPFAKLRQEEKAKKFAIIKIAHVIVNISLNLFFIILCPFLLKKNPEFFDWINVVYNSEVGIGYIFISNLIASGLTLLLLFPVVYNQINWSSFSFELTKKMFRYAFPLIIAGLAYATNEALDKILIGQMLGSEEAGIYALAYKLSIFMVLFVQAYRYAAEPYYFNNSKKETFKSNYAQIMRYFVMLSSFIFLTISLNIDYITKILEWLSPYKEYQNGLEIIPIILLAHLFLGIYYNLSMWYKLTNKTKYGAIISLIGAFITIIFNLILIPKIGYIGSAWATLICYFTMALISYFFSRKHYYIPYEKIKIGIYLISAVGIYLVAEYFEINWWLYNLMLIVLYLCIVILFENLNRTKNEFN